MHDSQSLPAAPPLAPAGEPEPATNRSALLIVFLVVFIDLLGFGIVLPLLPLYAKQILQPLFPGAPSSLNLIGGTMLGLLMSSFSLMQFLFAPVYGRISDRIGRRPILLLGLAGSVIFYTLFGIASEIGSAGYLVLGLGLMFVARIGAGMAGATISTAQAVIADSTPPERRAHGMALIGMAFGIGFTVGPLFGFASLFFRYEGAPGFAAAAVSLLALILAVMLLPETLKTGAQAGKRRWFDPRGTLNVLRTPAVGILVLTFFLATFAFGMMETTMALANQALLTGGVVQRLELSDEADKHTMQINFLIFSYVGFTLVLAQGLIYRRLVVRIGEVRFLKIGATMLWLGMIGAAVVVGIRGQGLSYPLLLALAAVVLSTAVIGWALLNPSLHSLISRRASAAQQGEVLGVNQSGSALARILGPFLGSALFFATPRHIGPYVFGAALLALVWWLCWRVRDQQDIV